MSLFTITGRFVNVIGSEFPEKDASRPDPECLEHAKLMTSSELFKNYTSSVKDECVKNMNEENF